MARRIGARNRPKTNESEPRSSTGDRLLVQGLIKGLRVFSLFDSLNPEWSVDEMTEELGLPRMTVYRLVKTLESEGYLIGDPASNRYHLGPMVLAAMHASWDHWRVLIRTARPYLEELATSTGETVTLAVDVDGVAVEIDSIVTPRPFRQQLAPGRVVGYAASAHGKVFAAHMSPEERDKLFERPFQPPAASPKDLESFHAELEKILEEGVAYDYEERDVGTCAVAAPVRDQLGEVVASLGLLAPPGRFGPREQETLAKAVQTSAQELSSFFGYRPLA